MNARFRHQVTSQPDLQRLRRDTDALLQEFDEPQAAGGDNGWAVGYLDLLLLLLTLFAVLLGISYIQNGMDPEADGGNGWLLSLAGIGPGSGPAPEVNPEVLLAAYQSRAPAPAAAAEPRQAVRPEPEPAPDKLPVHGDLLLTTEVLGEAELEQVLAEPEPLLQFDPRDLAQRVADIRSDGMGVQVKDRQVRVEMQDDILFPLGSAELGDNGKRLLQRLVDGLASRDIAIRVEGHTDDLPIATDRFPSNWELSSYRATTVARQLIALGVDQARIEVTGYADTRPRVPNDSPENRGRNRRVSLILEQWRPAVPASADASAEQRVALPEPGRWTEL